MEQHEIIKKIETIINEQVRPKLADHEGDIEILSVENGICRVKLLGQCSNCPSATFETEDLIKAPVLAEIPEITDVILVQEVSPDLLAMAYKILHHEIKEQTV